MELTKEQRLLSTIITEAWEDEGFKQRLIANPVAEIEKLTGQKINVPEGKKLVVQDQSSSSEIFVNIPAKPEMDDVELNEDELDIISGGGAPTPPKLGDPSTALNGIIGG